MKITVATEKPVTEPFLYSSAVPGSETPLQLAHGIARRLVTTPLVGMGADLYEGLPGLALFLAYAAVETGDSVLRERAEQVWREAEARELEKPNPTGGAFFGVAGQIYVASHLGRLWRRETLIDFAERRLATIAEEIDCDDRLDVSSGLAGIIACLQSLEAVRPQSLARALSWRCGDRLLELSTARNNTLSWSGLTQARGFFYGTSGIAWALARLRLPRFLNAALKATAYERGLLVGHGWDRHPQSDEPERSWCHGSPGIALARFEMFREIPDLILLNDARFAITAAANAPAAKNHSLCHGTMGNLEAWQEAARVWPSESEWQAREVAVVDEIRKQGPRVALPGNADAPGLLTGLAGIGLGLLRVASPERVPSVLRLEAP